MENKDTRPFDLKLAESGQKVGIEGLNNNVRIICTDRKGSHPIIVLVSRYDPVGYFSDNKDQIFCFNIKGERSGGAKLVMLPSGTVKGKSVFVGDKVLGAGGGEVVVTSQMRQSDFDKCSLVESKHVVETRMSDVELLDFYCQPTPMLSLDKYRAIANAAIARAISDGDVIPTSVIDNFIDKACEYHPNENKFFLWKSVKERLDYFIKEYKKGLKK